MCCFRVYTRIQFNSCMFSGFYYILQSLTSWTCPICQNLHAGDPRQLHLEVTFTVQKEIPEVWARKTICSNYTEVEMSYAIPHNLSFYNIVTFTFP